MQQKTKLLFKKFTTKKRNSDKFTSARDECMTRTVTHSVASCVMLLKVNGANVLMLLLLRSLRRCKRTVSAHGQTNSRTLCIYACSASRASSLKVKRKLRTPATAASGLQAPWAQMSACYPPSICKEKGLS